MNNTTALSKLTDHPFILIVAEDYLPITRMERKGVEYSDLTHQQRYRYETGFRLGQIVNQLERIEQASIFMGSYPYIKAWRNRFGQSEYFQYHMEVYCLAVAGLVDRLLLLINDLCHLGLNDENVRMRTVIKALRAKQYTDLISLFENLKMRTVKIKRMRNLYAHAQRFHEEDLYFISLLEFRLRQETTTYKDNLLKDDLKWHIKDYRRQKRKQIQDSNNTLAPIIKQFFDLLEAIYNQERKESE